MEDDLAGVGVSLHALAFLVLVSAADGGVNLVGRLEPMFSLAGDDVILPCALRTTDGVNNALDQSVEWQRPDLDSREVHFYRDLRDRNADQNPSYRGRTSLFRDELDTGNISLKLTRVKLDDSGNYTCSVTSLDRDKKVVIKLSVGAVSQPLISIVGPKDYGVALKCDSGGWYPEPEMTWLDSDGNILPGGPTETETDSEGRYTVRGHVTVQKTDTNTFTCRVLQQQINHKMETQFHVPGGVFPWSRGEMACLIIGVLALLAVLTVAVVVALYMWRKQKSQIALEKIKAVLEKIKAALKEAEAELASVNEELEKEKEDRVSVNEDQENRIHHNFHLKEGLEIEKKELEIEKKQLEIKIKILKKRKAVLERTEVELERNEVELEIENEVLERNEVELEIENEVLERNEVELEIENEVLEIENEVLDEREAELKKTKAELSRKDRELSRKDRELRRQERRLGRRERQLGAMSMLDRDKAELGAIAMLGAMPMLYREEVELNKVEYEQRAMAMLWAMAMLEGTKAVLKGTTADLESNEVGLGARKMLDKVEYELKGYKAHLDKEDVELYKEEYELKKRKAELGANEILAEMKKEMEEMDGIIDNSGGNQAGQTEMNRLIGPGSGDV